MRSFAIGILTLLMVFAFAVPYPAHATRQCWAYVDAVADTGTAAAWTWVAFGAEQYDVWGWHSLTRAKCDTFRTPEGCGGTYQLTLSIRTTSADSVDSLRVVWSSADTASKTDTIKVGATQPHVLVGTNAGTSWPCSQTLFISAPIYLYPKGKLWVQKFTATGGAAITYGGGKWDNFIKLDKLYPPY